MASSKGDSITAEERLAHRMIEENRKKYVDRKPPPDYARYMASKEQKSREVKKLGDPAPVILNKKKKA